MGSKIKTTYEIDSKFNPQGIIDGLRQVQKMITQTTSNADIFKGFSKALQEAQAKTNALKQQAEKGLTTQADIKSYQKLSSEVQSSLSGIIKQLGILSKDSLAAYEKDFRATIRSQMDALKVERSQLEQALGASIRGEGGKRSMFTGLTAESYVSQVRKGASFEDIFGPYRQALERALEEAKKPVESLTSSEELLLKDLQARHQVNQQTLEAERANLAILKTDKAMLVSARERLAEEAKTDVSQKEIRTVLSSSQFYSPLQNSLSDLGITKNDLIKILSEGFSKTANPNSVFTQVSRAGLSKTNYSNLAPDIQQLIREEIQMLYGNTVRGSAQSSLPDVRNEINSYTQQIKDSNTAIANLTQESKDLVSKIDPLVQKGAAAATQPQKINEAQQNLQEFVNWENTVGKPAYDAVAQSMGKIADKQTERQRGLNAIKQAQDSANRSTEQATIDLTNGAKAEAEFLEKQKQLVGIQGKVNQTFDQLTYRLKYFFSVFTLYRKVSQMVRQTYTDVQNLDKAFASIAMVTSKTVNTLWSSYSQYAQIANKLGQSTEDAIKTSALYYQQGLETNEVLQLTESTMKLATLAAQDFETSTQELTAAIRAFHMEMSEGEHVTDVYSELAAHAAADVSNIAAGMSKVASIASSAGASFESTAAFLTQIIETTQETGINAGTALKTVIARFTELKENVDDAEESFEDLDYNKVDKALKSVGINLKDEQGQIRDFDDIIIELSGVWDTLSRNQQRYIATIAAGSRQQSRFIALLEDHDRLMELIGTATDSAGRSNQQFAKYADTINYRLSKIKNTWEQFRISLVNEKTIKKVLDTVQKGLEKVLDFNWLDWTKIGTVFLLLGKTAAEGFMTGFKGISVGILTLFNDVASFLPKRLDALATKGTNKLSELIKNKDRPFFTQKQAKQINRLYGSQVVIKDINGNLRLDPNQDANKVDEKVDEELTKSKQQRYQAYGQAAGLAVMSGITAALTSENPWAPLVSSLVTGAVPAIGNALSGAISGAVSVGEAALTGGISIAISAAIGAIIAVFKKLSTDIKEQKEKMARLNSEYYDSIKNIEQLEKRQEALRTQIAETTEEVDKSKEAYETLTDKGERLQKLRDQVGKTNEEWEEYYTLSNEIAELAPQLVRRYDDEGNAVIDLAEQYEELIKQKKELYNENQSLLDAQMIQENRLNLQMANEEYRSAQGLIDFMDKGFGRELLNINSGNSKYTSVDGIDGLFVQGVSFWDYITKSNSEIRQMATGGITSTGKKGVLNALSDLTEDEALSLQAILKDIPDFTEIADEKNYKDIRKKIANIADDQESAYDTLIDVLENYSDNLEVYSQKVKIAQEALNQSISQYTNDYLLQIGAFENVSDKNVQNLMSKTLTNAAGIDIDEFNKAFEEKYKDYDFESVQAEENKRSYLLYKQVNEVLKTTPQLLEKFNTQLWTQIYSNPENKTYSDQFYNVYRKRNELSDDEIQAWLDNTKTERDAWNNRVKELGNFLGLVHGNFSWGGLEESLYELKDGNEDSVNFANYLLENDVLADKIIGKTNNYKELSPTKAKNFQKDMQKLFKNVSEDQFTKILNIDWEKYDLIDADDFWESVKKDLDNPDNFDEIKETLTEYFANNIINYDELSEKVDKQYEKLVKKSLDAYEKAMISSIENGYLDDDALEALNAAGAPIGKIMNEDLTLNKEALKEWKDEAVASFRQIYNVIEEYHKKRMEDLDTLISLQEHQEDLTEAELLEKAILLGFNDADQAHLQSILDQKEGVEAIVAALKEWKETDQTDFEESAFDKLIEGRARAGEGADKVAEKNIADKAKEQAEKIEEANKKIADSYQDILDKQQDLIDKQNELNKVLYGSDTYKGSLDPMYNYEQRLERITEEIDDAKEALDDYTTENPNGALGTLMNGYHNEAVNLAAQNSIYEGAIDSTINALNNELTNYLATSDHGFDTNVSDFYKYNPIYKIFEVNQDAINKARMNDDLKNYIYEQLSAMNNYEKKITENEKKIKQREKEFQDYQKKVRDDYISVQDKVVEMLKEKYQEEIDDKKDMYEALEKADSDYLDALQKAIDKERKLRDKQKKWDDLATKEKRLSLMRRDTSGANQKDIQSLQNEIQDDRQQLLDDTVDTIVDNLKELYDSQKESRDAEIEYQQSVLDNANLIKEANDIMLSWKSLEDMQAWMAENTKDFEKLSDETVEKMQEDWAEMYFNVQEYNELTQKDIKDVFDYTSAEIQGEIESTTETLTTEASRALQEVTKSVEDSIKGAENAVTSAMKALTEAQEAYNKAIQEYNDLINEINNEQNKQEEENNKDNDFTPTARTLELIDQYNSGNNNMYSRSSIEKTAQTELDSDQLAYFKNNTNYYSRDFGDYNNWLGEQNQIVAEQKQTTIERANRFRSWKDNSGNFLTLQEFDALATQDLSQAYTWLSNAIPNLTEKAYNEYVNTFTRVQNEKLNGTNSPAMRAQYGRYIIPSYYASGGLVSYTGPAWVDGTKSKPEAFLSAEDTKRIGDAANILRDIFMPWSARNDMQSWMAMNANSFVNSLGDSNIEININVDSIATEDQVDYLINRMKDEITEAANPIGTTVIRR